MRDRRVVYAVGAAYLVVLAVLVTGPWGRELNRFTIWLYVEFRTDVPIAPLRALPEHYGFVLNVFLFVPLGALLALVTGRPWWWITLVACAGSAAVELAQGAWLSRVGDWHDVAANTLGALVGAVAVSLLARSGSRRAGRPATRRRP
jgi:glycopeptide antibiotics resistance protein